VEGHDVEIAPGDIRDGAALDRALDGVVDVYHLAALTRSRTRRGMIETNVGGTEKLLRAAVRARLPGRFLLCSSLAAAGPSPDGQAIDESAPCRPVTWYGESKRLAEEAARRESEHLAVTIVRPPAVYGPRDRDFLGVFQAAARGLAPILGSRPHRYNFVYVEDLAEGIVEAARSDGTVGRTYYVTHPEVLTTETFADHVARAVGRSVRHLRIPDGLLGLAARIGDLIGQLTTRPPIINRQRLNDFTADPWLCSGEALARDAGWRASIDAAEGTRRTVAWCREHGELPPSR
jgi:nucleoside-diphosphate-sugar epimerase